MPETYEEVPGPPGYPLVGNLLGLDKKCPYVTLESWARQYGGVCQVRITGEDWIIPATYEAHHEILVSSGQAFGGRHKTFRLDCIFEDQGSFGTQMTATHWDPVTKYLIKYTGIFGDGNSKVNPILTNLLEDLITQMKSFDGQAADVRSLIEDWTFGTFYATLTGKPSLNTDENRVLLRQMVMDTTTVLGVGGSIQLDMFPWLRYFGNEAYKMIVKIVELKQTLFTKLWVASREEEFTVDQPTNLLQAMRDTSNPHSPNFQPEVTDSMHKAQFFDFMLGGSPHNARLCYAFLNILMHFPEVLPRLQAEVDDVTGKSSRRPALSDVDRMPYTRATVFELLRYVSVAPMAGRRAVEDTTLLGKYKIPEGTVVMLHFFAVNHDEEFWGDPWVFRPERFLDDKGQLVPPDHENRKHMLAFGAGPRICPAVDYAWKRIFIFTAYIAQSFNIEQDETAELVNCDPRTYPLGFTLEPPSFRVKLIPRKP